MISWIRYRRTFCLAFLEAKQAPAGCVPSAREMET